MFSILFQAPDSNVQHVFQFVDEVDLRNKVDIEVHSGNLLATDYRLLFSFYNAGHKKIRIDDKLVFELTRL